MRMVHCDPPDTASSGIEAKTQSACGLNHLWVRSPRIYADQLENIFSGEIPMRFIFSALIAVFALSLSGASAQAGLFGGCGLGCNPCCEPAPVCCEPAPVCDACDPCAPKCRGGLLHKFFHKHHHADCGCDAAPVCCEPAPAPVCCEPAPVCDPCAPRHSHLKAMLARIKARHASCCEPACDSCGVEVAAPSCGGCN